MISNLTRLSLSGDSDYEVHCRPAHGFIHVLPITKNMSEFTRVIQEQRISGNMDTPEGGFDAMLQATVCKVRARFVNCTLCTLCVNVYLSVLLIGQNSVAQISSSAISLTLETIRECLRCDLRHN